jgi:GNAT superfamily N-acetyltransferase
MPTAKPLSVDLVIRPARQVDYEHAVRLLTAQLLEHRLPADPDGVARGVECALALSSAWLWLAERDGQPAAICLANEIVSVEHGGLGLWVEELYVVPSARRMGVARALLEKIFRHAIERDVRAIDLEVVPTQIAASALYRALGFQEVHRNRLSLTLGRPEVRSRFERS